MPWVNQCTQLWEKNQICKIRQKKKKNLVQHAFNLFLNDTRVLDTRSATAMYIEGENGKKCKKITCILYKWLKAKINVFWICFFPLRLKKMSKHVDFSFWGKPRGFFKLLLWLYLPVTFPSSAYSPILFGGLAQQGLPLTYTMGSCRIFSQIMGPSFGHFSPQAFSIAAVNPSIVGWPQQ